MVVGRRSRSRSWFVLALASVVSVAEPGAAQPTPAPAANTEPEPADHAAVEPPVAVATPVEYPAGETRSASVVLELDVDTNGQVTAARAVSGDLPFSDVAVTAARAWKFVPAKRAGHPVRSRFRFSVQFEPPPVEEAPVEAPTEAASTKRASQPPGPAPLLEVVVQGERPRKPPPGTVTITREEAQALPGTFGDPLRAIEAQPGVVPIVSGLPSFFVRGAPPGNVGYFFDGVDVPLLYHAFFGPSVIQPALIKDVEFYKGSAPVEYGRFAGPVVAASLSPLEHRLGGEASVRLIDAGGIVEAPFGSCPEPGKANCSLGSVRVGGRYSYTGLILSQLGDAKLDYWDYQAQGGITFGRSDELSVLAFGAYDFFDAGANSSQGGGKVRFHRADLRWDHRAGHTHVRVALTGGYDSTGGVETTTSTVRDRSARLRTELTSDLSEAVTLHAGIDGRIDDFQLETDPLLLNFADYSRLFQPRTQTTVGGYLSFELRPTRRITVVPGIRSDMYWDRGQSATGVDPRISAAFAVTDSITIETSFGISHELPNFVPNVPAAQVADLAGGLQEAVSFDSGVKWKLPGDITAKATVFRAGYFNALDPLGGKRDFSIDREVLDQRSTIASGGLELSISRPLTRKLGGFLAYTLSHTVESYGTQENVSGFDRPHVLQAALGYDFGRGWTAGTRAVFYSGVPELNLQGTPHFSSDRRGRPYFRLDLRAEKRWRLGATGWWGVIFEMLNATGTTEVVRLDCGERCAERVAGPVVLPSLGVQAGF
jgi:TonB family protein